MVEKRDTDADADGEEEAEVEDKMVEQKNVCKKFCLYIKFLVFLKSGKIGRKVGGIGKI